MTDRPTQGVLDGFEPEENRRKKNKVSVKKLKHYLKSAWYWQKKKDFLFEKISVLRSRAEKITTSYQDAPTFGGFEDHRQAVIAEMVDTQKKYGEAVNECNDKLAEINFFIGCLQDYQERIVMEYRYIHFENWQDIAYKLNYEERQIYRIHGKALIDLLTIHKTMVKNGKGLF